MDHRSTVLASAGYGAMGALLAVLVQASDDLFTTFVANNAVDPHPYQRTVESVLKAITTIPETPDWADARKHFIAMVEHYRAIAALLPPSDMAAFREINRELGETQLIARLAIDRLRRHLGIPDGGY